MYPAVLILHSWVRWIVLVAAAMALISLLKPGDGARARADRAVFGLMIALDIQLLLGLLLYVALSPFTTVALQDMGAAMRNPQLRFWAVEHVTMMFAAVILVHVGRVLARKAPTADSKRTKLLVCVGIAILAILGGLPWPGTPNGRPFIRV
jgi:hypothetical protein